MPLIRVELEVRVSRDAFGSSKYFCVSQSFHGMTLWKKTLTRYLSSLSYACSSDQGSVYLIPIEIHTPLIFAHLACAEIKGSKFLQ